MPLSPAEHEHRSAEFSNPERRNNPVAAGIQKIQGGLRWLWQERTSNIGPIQPIVPIQPTENPPRQPPKPEPSEPQPPSPPPGKGDEFIPSKPEPPPSTYPRPKPQAPEEEPK